MARQPGSMAISNPAAGRLKPPRLGRRFGRRIGRRFPHLRRPLLRNQEPTELGAIALVGGHVLAQGGEAAGAFVARAYTTGAGQPHYKIEAKHRVIRQAEACVEVSNAFQLPVARAQA